MFTQVNRFRVMLGVVVTCLALSTAANALVIPPVQAEAIRHQIVMEPNYGVFDWVYAQTPNRNTVVLRGQVRLPTTKSGIEGRVRKVEGVSRVINQIEVLPVSPSDDQIRVAMYRSIFRYNGPLFRYANSVNPPIHIIVNNGRVTLKGTVGDTGDRQLAYFAARNVPGVFEVNNELTVSRS